MSEDETMFVEIDDEAEQENKFLLFKLGAEEYGINIAMVQSIEEMQSIVAIPDMPEYVKGVINMRGQVIPVIDLRLNFGMEERDYDDRTCMIITTVNETNIGLIVDTVSEVEDIPEKNVEPPPKFKSESKREYYISGIGKVNDEVKILLDVTKLLQDTEVEEINAKAQ